MTSRRLRTPRAVLHARFNPDFEIVFEALPVTDLELELEEGQSAAQVELLDFVSDTGEAWRFNPIGPWMRTEVGVEASFELTDDDAFEVFEVEAESATTRARTVLRVRIRPAVEAFDALPHVPVVNKATRVLTTLSISADYASFSDFAEVVAAIDAVNVGVVSRLEAGDVQAIRILHARMNSPLLITIGVVAGVIAGVPLARALLTPAAVNAVALVLQLWVERKQSQTQREQAVTDIAEVVAETCRDLRHDQDKELISAMTAMTDALDRTARLLRDKKVEISVGPVKLSRE